MGFYVNVKSKKGCASQINKLWNIQFGDFLIYTPSRIKEEINFIQNDEKSKHLSYVNSVKIWNETFPIYKNGSGQVFIRAFGYDEEKSNKFKKENELIKNKIQFILDHRLLFSEISSLRDAIDTFDMDIKGDYIENGKLKYYDQPTFLNLPQKPKDNVFNKCLELNSPSLWQAYLNILDNGLNYENWQNIRNYNVALNHSFSENSTIWQRCEKLAYIRDKENYGLYGRYQNGSLPYELDLIKAITFSEIEFEDYLKSFNKNENKNIDNIISLRYA